MLWQVLTEVDPVVVTYWYRAPGETTQLHFIFTRGMMIIHPLEVLLGAKHYTKAVGSHFYAYFSSIETHRFVPDMWSAGCIFAELYMLAPLFRGDPSGTQHLDYLRPWPYNSFNREGNERIPLRPAAKDLQNHGLAQPRRRQRCDDVIFFMSW